MNKIENNNNFELQFGLVDNQYSKIVNNTNFDLETLSIFLDKKSEQIEHSKELVQAITPCIFKEGSEDKSEKNALSRHLLLLDFDENPKIDLLLKKFVDYTFFAYTTHSHQTPNSKPEKHFKNRIRILIPFQTPIANKTEWNSWGRLTLENWLKELGCLDGTQFEVDPKSFTYNQIGFCPSINPLNGKCETWKNAKKILDVYSLERIEAVEDIQVKIINENVDFSKSDLALIIKYLSTKNELQSIDQEERQKWAAALEAIGGCEYDFKFLDYYLKKVDTKTKSETVWNRAQNWSGEKHAGLIFKHLTRQERLDCGITVNCDVSPDFIKYNCDNNIEKRNFTLESNEFLHINHLGEDRVMLLKAEMGTGKNFIWNKFEEPVLVYTVLNSIKNQQNSSDNEAVHYVYDDAKHKLEEIKNGTFSKEQIAETTLVIDEAHNFGLASYRRPALVCLEEMMKLGFKRIVLQSATVLDDDFDDLIKLDVIVTVKRENPIIINYKRRFCEDYADTVLDLVKRSTYKCLVLNNSKKKNEAYSELLNKSGIKGFCVDSKTTRKPGDEAFDLANDIDYEMKDNTYILGTSSLVEGLNIQDKIEIANVIVVGVESPNFIKQLAGRFRKAKEVNIFHLLLKSENDKSFNINAFLYKEKLKRTIQIESELSVAEAVKRLDEYNFNNNNNIEVIDVLAVAEADIVSVAKSNSSLKEIDNMIARSNKVFLNGVLKFSVLNRLTAKSEIDTIQFNINLEYAKKRIEGMNLSWNNSKDVKDINEVISQANSIALKQAQLNSKQKEGIIIDYIESFIQNYKGVFEKTKLFSELNKNHADTEENMFFGKPSNDKIVIGKVDCKEELQKLYSAFCSENSLKCTQKGFESFKYDINQSLLDLVQLCEDLTLDTKEKYLQILDNCRSDSIKTVKNRALAASSKFDVSHKLEKEWAIGSMLTNYDCKEIIAYIIESNIGTTVTPENFRKEMYKDIWVKHHKNEKVKFEGGKIIIEIKQPTRILTQFMKLENGSRKMIAGKQQPTWNINSYYR